MMTASMEWCRHYTGVVGGPLNSWDQRSCDAGVAYKQVVGVDADGRKVYPCFERPASIAVPCAQRSFLSDEEKRVRDEETKAHIAKFLEELASDICPHCHEPILRKQQVGPCVYAEPCGHRLYQGRV